MFRSRMKSLGGKKGLAILGAAVLLVISAGAALAVSPVVDLSQEQQNFKILGDKANSYMGEVTGSADFNKDGYADLLLGAGGYPTNGILSGAAFVILGGPQTQPSIDVANASFKVLGGGAGHALGHAVAAGNVIGDNYPDMIISADGYGNERGAVYVIQGGPNITGSLDLKTGQATTVIYGAAIGDRFGRAVTSANVNGDAFDDIIVGAYTVSTGGKAERGAVYVILGGQTLPPVIDLQTSPSAAALTILGSAGDSDGLAPQPAAAGADLFFEDNLTSLDATNEIGDRLGRSVAAADVNGDGKSDIIAGAYGANVGGKNDAGRTYVIYGSSSLPATIDLSATTPGPVLEGVDADDQAGFYVAGSDLNKDNKAEVIVGAYLSEGAGNATGSEAGEVYVVLGGNLSGTINLANAAMAVYGAAAGDRVGRSLASGDFNDDTFNDLVIGASRADPGGRVDAGAVYALLGGATLPASVTVGVNGGAALTILGDVGNPVVCAETVNNSAPDCADEAGHSTSVGDFNGDGTADIIVGALYANPGPGLQDAGITYIVYGGYIGGLQTKTLYMPVAKNNGN